MRMLKNLFYVLMMSFALMFNAFAADISIFNWTANIADGVVSGVARCGPKSGSTLTSAKSWVSSNWATQNGGCFCRVQGIEDVSDWKDLNDAGSYWYGSGINFSGGFEECSQNCAATCAQKFESDNYYQESLCGGTCPVSGSMTQYTINYYMDGGTGCENTTYTDSAIICTPTRDGYTFDGWMDNNTDEIYNGGETVSNINLDLVAFWTINNYTITYNLNGGTGCSNTTYTSSDTVALCTPTRDGYEFGGWYDNAEFNGDAVTEIASGSTGNKTYYAKWETAKFTITTTSMTANDTFKWSMSAAGTFYVDCGDNGVLSGTGVSGNTITRSNTTMSQYTCTYPNAGTHTIRMNGTATGYNANSGSASYAAIGFSTANYSNNTPTKIAGISGSLGAIFGTIGNGDTLATQPRFSSTFYGCSGLTGTIPDNLFAGISAAPASYMFSSTFHACSKLTGAIPENLFAGISGAPAQYMFYSTFVNCSGLTGSIPENLFAGISGAPAEGMFAFTFGNCSGLTGAIPENLFAGISGTPANNMFESTFFGGSKLTGFTDGTTTTSYVPADFLSGIDTNTSVSNQALYMFTGTGLFNPCPANTYAVTREQFSNAGKPWCAPCPTGTTSSAGSTSVDQCVVPSYTITYDMDGGTGCSNTTYTSSDTVTLCTPTRDGYIFNGWYDNSGLTGTAVTEIASGSTGNKEYWAKWIEYKFQLTTTSMTANDTFKWSMSAAGTFYVDCGDGGVLSGTGVSGNTITRSDTLESQYTCTYPNAGTHTIRFGGTATGYNANSGSASYAAIGFSTANYSNNTPTKIAGISGSLGAIFGTIGNGDTLATQPRFASTFSDCSKLTGSIPEKLFAGISGAPAEFMFFGTFQACSGLTGSIPEKLFAGISGAPASSMFSATFLACSGLTGSIPANLFAGISGAPAEYMFKGTFLACRGLTGAIPENLFAGISGAPAEYMFGSTFYGCSGLTGSIPANLFAGIKGKPAEFMFSTTFLDCRGLTGSIPSNLFAGISGAPANNMFEGTFVRCSKLTGFTDGTTTTSYVPADFLSGITTNTSVSNQVSSMFADTGLVNPCPANTYTVTRAQFSDADKPWCAPCPDGTTSSAGSTSVDQCVVPSYTITYNLNSGTGCSNTTYTDSAIICTPTRDGYTFDGWMDNNTDEMYNGGETVSNINLDLVAFWTINNYTITYDMDGGTGCSNTTYTSSDTVTLCTPTRDGYEFDGWYDNAELTGNTITTISSGSTGNREYWAKWNLVCTENQMITTDGCVDAKFTITTIELPANTTIEFNGDAEGTFYIDWGDGSDVMEQNFVGNRHKYANAGVYTIKLGGRATGYRSNFPVIYFNFANKIASVSGSLGQIFPTLNNGENDATLQPNFSQTFDNAINLTSLPSELFDGVYGSLDKMFDRTFYGCTGLQTLPSGLFSGITGGANNMFYQTFYGCSGLKSLPGDLFEDVTNSAINMFYQTFQGCSSLESIPETLFSGIRDGAKNLFGSTFYKCSALKTLPSGLFSNIQSVDEAMFRVTFGETGLIEIPSGLFANITESARYLFSGTFFKCKNLTTIPENLFAQMTTTHSLFPEMFARCSNLKEVPANLFANLSGVISLDMFWHTFSNTGLESFRYPNGETTSYIPMDFFGDITGYEQPTSSLDPGSVFDDSNLAQSCPANMYIYDLPIDTSPYVSCTPCPNEYPLSEGGKINSNMCYKIVNINCSELNPWQSSNGNPIYANNAATAKQYAQMGATPVLIDANACDMVGANCNPGYKEGIGTTVTTAQLLSSIVNSATEADSDLDSDSVYRYVDNTCSMPYNGYIDCDLLTSSFGNEINSYLVNFDYGEIRGTGKCTALTATGDLGASDIVDSADFNESEYGTNCWCNITKLKTSDDNTQNIQSKWIFNYDFGNNTYSNMDQFDRYVTCDLYCANYCAGALHYSTEYRTFMYSNSVLAPQEKQTYICEIDAYTIAFDLNDGEFPVGVVVPENYTTESDTISLPVPMLDGYTFNGWYENAELTGDAVSEIPSGSIGNKTYYAKWTRNEFVCESGIWLHIGDEDKVCMYETKPDTPTMVVETQNGRYYMMLNENADAPIHDGSNKKMRVEIGNRIYNVHDASVNMK